MKLPKVDVPLWAIGVAFVVLLGWFEWRMSQRQYREPERATETKRSASAPEIVVRGLPPPTGRDFTDRQIARLRRDYERSNIATLAEFERLLAERLDALSGSVSDDLGEDAQPDAVSGDGGTGDDSGPVLTLREWKFTKPAPRGGTAGLFANLDGDFEFDVDPAPVPFMEYDGRWALALEWREPLTDREDRGSELAVLFRWKPLRLGRTRPYGGADVTEEGDADAVGGVEWVGGKRPWE